MEEEQRFLRGQLNVVAQMRQPPGRQHHFQIRHDIFTADRAENRLLKLALEHVCQATHDPASWRLSHELRHLLAEVSASRQIEQDWRAWRSDRLMAHYQPIKPWCELILNKQMPFATAGEWRGISMLFPMERLFERYVEAHLRRQLLPGVRLTAQAARQSLCEHMGAPMFRLEPDLLIEQNDRRWILDTKWKRLDGSDCAGKYKLSQADLYQLYAYGQKYLQGKGELVLIYPRHAGFGEPLQPFDFDADLRLWVLPFDLDAGRLCGASLANLPLGCLTEPAIDLSNVAYSATNAAQKATANTRSDVTRLCTLF